MASHRLPQLPTMGGDSRTAQSKSSAKFSAEPAKEIEETVLHVEGTSKVVKISNDGLSELTEIKAKRQEESLTSLETSSVQKDQVDDQLLVEADRQVKSEIAKKRVSGRIKEKIGTVTDMDSNGDCSSEKRRGDSKNTPDYLLPKSSYLQNSKQAARKNKPVVKRPYNKGNKGIGKQKGVDAKPADVEQLAISTVDEKGTTESVKLDQLDSDGVHLPRQILIYPAEVPSADQIEKLLAGSTEAHLLLAPVHLEEGHMKWAKVTGHPYWPCMVARCPFSKIFTRVKGETRVARLYHVQFFGDECERGWIAEPSLMDFKGKADFLVKADEYRESLKKLSKKAKTHYNPFVVKENRETAWNIAVAEAEHALTLSLEDRNIQYMFQYLFVDNIKKERKQVKLKERTLEALEKSPTPKATKGEKRKLNATEASLESPAQNVSKKQRVDTESPKTPMKQTVSFHIYFSLHSSTTHKEHPDWDAETLRLFLRKQWKAERMIESPTSVTDIKNPSSCATEDKHNAVLESVKSPLRKTVPFQTYFGTHLAATRIEHPDWDEEILRIFLRKQWKAERVVLSPPNVNEEITAPSSSAVVGKTTPSKDSAEKTAQPTLMDFWRKSGLGVVPTNMTESPPTSAASQKQELPCHEPPSSNGDLASRKGRPRKSNIDTEVIGASPEHMETNEEDTTAQSKRTRTLRLLSNDKQTAPSPHSVANEVSDVSTTLEQSGKTKPALARKPSQDSDSSSEGKGRKECEPYELEIFKLVSTCKLDKEKVCSVCEKTGEMLDCSGKCNQHFHAACVNMEPKPDLTYMCDECLSGVHSCFSCKQADSSTVRCCISTCGKYYHEACVKKHRLTRTENKGFVCPMHVCSTCSVDNIRNPRAMKGRFYRCIRCPIAYHVGDHCIPAGSVVLGGQSIICADHFKPNKALSCHTRININWCFTCSKGGSLLCCEACPASFHYECVKVEKTPDEAWYCEECEAGMRPLYGTIVWIKVGNYRWWPGEICHPRNVPLNIQEKAHQVGEFPVRFFGSHDYYWIHRGRVFLFQEGDKASTDYVKGNIVRVYKKGVEEATEAMKAWTSVQDKKDEQEQERNGKRPAPFKLVKFNVPIGNVQVQKADLSEIPICECKPDGDDACASECLNRMMFYECHPASCPAGERCHNQRFQKRQHAHVEPFKCESRGWGLRCAQDIKKGEFVIEYVGDLIDEMECKKRIEQAHVDNITNFYMLTLDKNRIIDAGPKGNYSRFMNHSCAPNLVTQKWTINGDIRVGLFALEDITKGSELTFNYNLECLGNEKKACACGADNCSGFLGVRPKATPAAAAKEKLARELKKKKKKKIEQRKMYEDECFRCGVGGELVMCDVTNCPKVYHLQCLKLTKAPTGKWRCPWHHCDVCGKHAVSKCIECPDSFCINHSEGNIFSKNGIQVCEDHVDLLEAPLLGDSTAAARLQVEGGQDVENHVGAECNKPQLEEGQESIKTLPAMSTKRKATGGDEALPQQKLKRKYTKQVKSVLVDSGGDKCPVLKITTTDNQKPKTNGVSAGVKIKSKIEALPSKDVQAKPPKPRTENKLKPSLTNGQLTPPVNGGLIGKLKTNGHLNDSDDADSNSGLVIDL